MQVRYSDTEIFFIKSDDENMQYASDCHCCIYNLVLISLLLLCNFSCNSALSRSHGVFKQHRDLTESTGDKMHCLALFPQRQYKYKQADPRRIFQQRTPKYVVFLTSDYCLASEVVGGGVVGLCLCLCVPYDVDSFTQMEVYHGLSSYFLPLILPDCCLGNIFCCIRLCLAFNSWSWTVG